jgi:hypothetical protein
MKSPDEIRQEIDFKKTLARNLGLDDLFHQLFYEFGLLRLAQTDCTRFPFIESVGLLGSEGSEEVLKLVTGGKELIFSCRQTSPLSTTEFLGLYVNGSRVFEVATSERIHPGNGIITSFIDGDWVDTVRGLHGHMSVVLDAERAKYELQRLHDTARKFGVKPD